MSVIYTIEPNFKTDWHFIGIPQLENYNAEAITRLYKKLTNETFLERKLLGLEWTECEHGKTFWT